MGKGGFGLGLVVPVQFPISVGEHFLSGISGEGQLGARQNYYQESCLKTV